jgi:hypothetical protein
MRGASSNKILPAILLRIPTFVVITGCATEILSASEMPTGKSQLVKENYKTEIPIYYDFKDVPVPAGLEIEREKSFTFQTPESTIGLMSFSGHLESEFLINFFHSKMHEDGWRLLSSFKVGKNILFFQKENRFCIITIVSKTFTPEVEILVTPSFQRGQ